MLITLKQASDRLLKGEVVALPTETVYGLAALLHQPLAIAEIFRLKGRPQDNPLIIHLASAEDMAPYLRENPPPGTWQLAAAFWPGPLTLILPIKEELVPAIARAHQPTAGFRVPDHADILSVLRLTGAAVAPSANLSGKPSPTCAEHVLRDFEGKVPVVDGGPCQKGVESTILLFKDYAWEVARLGALSPEAFQPILGYVPQLLQTDLLCPGRRYKHYAPQAKLLLGLSEYAQDAEVVIGFSDRTYPGAKKVLSLGNSDDPSNVLRSLYQTLRQLDQDEIQSAWIDFNIPSEGPWLTLRERLKRAAQ